MKRESIILITLTIVLIFLILKYNANKQCNTNISFNTLIYKNKKLDSILTKEKIIINQDTLEILGIKLLTGELVLENGKQYYYEDIKNKFQNDTINKTLKNL